MESSFVLASASLGSDTSEARGLALGPDETPYVLLTEAPWLVRYSATTGEALSVQSDLAWVDDFVIGADGGPVLFGAVADEASGVDVMQIQRLDSSGALVGSARWSVETMLSEDEVYPQHAEFAGATLRPDGSILVAILGLWQLKVGVIDPSATPFGVEELSTTELITAADQDGEVSDHYAGRTPTDYAVMADGGLLLAGHLGDRSTRVDGTWLATLAPSGELAAHVVDTRYDLFLPNKRVAINTAGDVYHAWSWAFTDREPNSGYVARSNLALGQSWQKMITSESVATYISRIVALDDAAVALGSGEHGPFMARFSPSGSEDPQILSLPKLPVDAALTSDGHVLVLGSASAGHELTSYQIGASAVALPAGSNCGRNDECSSARCCLLADEPVGVCSDSPVCALDSRCQSGAECESGVCWTPSSASHGICTSQCTGSSECASGYYCATPTCAEPPCASFCLADCLSSGSSRCSQLGAGLECVETANSEGVAVSLCNGL